MKIKHIFTSALIFATVAVYGQNMNFPDIRIGNSATGKIVLNGSNLQMPRIGLGSGTDSVLTIVNGVVKKVPRSSITSPTPSLDQVLNVGFTSELPISVGAISAGSGSITSAPTQPTNIVRLSDLSNYMDLTTNQTAAGNKIFTNNVATGGTLMVGSASGNNMFFDNSGSGYMSFSARNNGASQGMNWNAAEFFFNGKMSFPSGLLEYPSFGSGNFVFNNARSAGSTLFQNNGVNRLEITSSLSSFTGPLRVSENDNNDNSALRNGDLPVKLAPYQTIANLSTNLTASAVKYPSVNAVNTGLADKASLTLDNIYNSASSWSQRYRKISDGTVYSDLGWDSFRISRGSSYTFYGYNLMAHQTSPGNSFTVSFPSTITGNFTTNFRALQGTVALLGDFATGQTIGANTTGNAASATLWTNQQFIGASPSIAAFMTNQSGTNNWGFSTPTQAKAALAISLQNATSVNGVTNNVIQTTGNTVSGSLSKGTTLFFEPTYGASGAGVLNAYDYPQSQPLPLVLNAGGGNVGLGKTNPAQKLDVSGVIRTDERIIIDKPTGGLGIDITNATDATLKMGVTAAGAATKYGWIGSDVSNQNLVLNQDNGGNVGIGTTTATSKLTVNGDIEITNSTKGAILTAPNGSRWRITVSNTGVLSTTSIP